MKKLLFFSILLLFGCGDDPVEETSTGCKPTEVLTNGSISGFTDDLFTYEGNQITTIDNYTYTYENGLATRATEDNFEYVEFTYDSQDRVIQTQSFRENDENDFDLISHYEYEYSGELLTKAINKLNSDEYVYFRNEVTTNIDSIISYNSEDEVKFKEYIEYDNNPNIYSNLNVPHYNFRFWILKTTRNNIVRYDKFNDAFPEPGWYTVNYEYNEFDYPVRAMLEFSTGETKDREINFVGCE
ncbi:MAG: hypothetical protein P1U56_19810 [Saprospiraceae bacterium]|nr:hypothetical protein [Saprospiraceae bacterium]